jgi:hypothetical protein
MTNIAINFPDGVTFGKGTASLLNNTASQAIVNLTGISGGFINAVVEIDATADKRQEFLLLFSKNYTGTAWSISSMTTTGEDSLTTFDIDTSGILRASVGLHAGTYTSGLCTYSINSPALGATFPVTVSPSSIIGNSDIAMASGYGISFGNETLKNYDESITTTFTITFIGGATKTGTVHLCRVGRMVSASFEGMGLTSATASGTFSAPAIPAGFRPHIQVLCPCVAYENGTPQAGAGAIIFATSGVITGVKTLALGGFAGGASGYTGVDNCSFCWTSAI